MKPSLVAAIAAGLSTITAPVFGNRTVVRGSHKKSEAWERTHGFPGAKLMRKAINRKIGLRS